MRLLRLDLRSRRGRPRRRDPARNRVWGHPRGLVLPGLRRTGQRLRALRRL